MALAYGISASGSAMSLGQGSCLPKYTISASYKNQFFPDRYYDIIPRLFLPIDLGKSLCL